MSMQEKDVNEFVMWFEFWHSLDNNVQYEDTSHEITQLCNRPILALNSYDKSIR